MGDRFYQQQQAYFGKQRYKKLVSGEKEVKPKKADLISALEEIVGEALPSIKNVTIADLNKLIKAFSDE